MIDLIRNDWLTIRVQRKRHKKKRINKKWLKKYGFTSAPDPKVYKLIGNTIVGHSKTIEKLLKALERQ